MTMKESPSRMMCYAIPSTCLLNFVMVIVVSLTSSMAESLNWGAFIGLDVCVLPR